MKVLVTGATGFVGRALVAQLVALGNVEVLALTRQVPANPVTGAKYHPGGDLISQTQWQPVLASVHVLVHTAGRAHVLNDRAADPLAEFRRVNVTGTLRLAEQAAAMGVQRFVFMSSIGVNGVQSAAGKVFSELDKPSPHNTYALSKWEAEQGLLRVADETGLEVVIIRPPLVYGRGAPGNFGSLMRWLTRGLPLPLGAIHNQRSLVALDNLVDLIVTCLTHPAAANQTFLVSDGEDVSTTELLRRMGQALGRPARLIPFPASWLKLAATLVGKQDVAQRLCGSLQVDIEKTQRLLGWTPPVSLDEGLRRAAGL
jgi:nucleoside-diphosphate-sugar epimerase